MWRQPHCFLLNHCDKTRVDLNEWKVAWKVSVFLAWGFHNILGTSSLWRSLLCSVWWRSMGRFHTENKNKPEVGSFSLQWWFSVITAMDAMQETKVRKLINAQTFNYSPSRTRAGEIPFPRQNISRWNPWVSSADISVKTCLSPSPPVGPVQPAGRGCSAAQPGWSLPIPSAGNGEPRIRCSTTSQKTHLPASLPSPLIARWSLQDLLRGLKEMVAQMPCSPRRYPFSSVNYWACDFSSKRSGEKCELWRGALRCVFVGSSRM